MTVQAYYHFSAKSNKSIGILFLFKLAAKENFMSIEEKMPERLKERLTAIGIPLSIYETRARKCIRILQDCDLSELGELTAVPWFKDAFFCENPEPGKTKAFADGCIAVQDAASIVPVVALNPKPKEDVLDACAAPGQKTLLINELMKGKGEIVANDINRKRYKRMKRLLDGLANITAINENAITLRFENNEKFDKILVDAPCSGEGIVNKPLKLFKIWKEERIEMLSERQKAILENTFSLLKKNGILVYSTCTFEPEENEIVVDNLLKKYKHAKIEKIDIPGLNHHNGFTVWHGRKLSPNLVNCLRIYPQDNGTNGMFVAKIMKK